ncbi:hypothetical protein ABZ743_24145 [Streptomyces sp. NPDC006662]|uniref:hypothetical protein n=1 Tax=Streptomyces sp. NPDC006662 TaxID=3156902 RepID=UPI0033E39F34
MPRDMDLGDRAKALEQLGVIRSAHAAIVAVVKGRPVREAGGSAGRPAPVALLAHRMDQIRDQGGTGFLAAHLARLTADTSWKDGPSSTVAGHLVGATLKPHRPRPQDAAPR